jgi:hypothetical protein
MDSSPSPYFNAPPALALRVVGLAGQPPEASRRLDISAFKKNFFIAYQKNIDIFYNKDGTLDE